MAIKKRASTKRKFVRKPKAKKVASKRMPTLQYATTNESFTLDNIDPNQIYQVVASINDFPRSQLIGQAYKEYKIDKVELTFQADYNTFSEGTTILAGTTIPQLYYILDRTGTGSVWDVPSLEQMGVKPVPFTRKITRYFKPNTLGVVQNSSSLPSATLTPTGTASIQSAEIHMGKWISTQWDCNTVTRNTPISWYGADFIVQQDNTLATTHVGNLVITCHFSFRGASLPPIPTTVTPAVRVAPQLLATLAE